MIPQFFVKSSGEQINYNKFDYVPGASMIFDWGNPESYPPGQGAGGTTYNSAIYPAGEPNGVFETGGGIAASMWSSAYTGSIQFNASNGLNVEFSTSFPTGAMSVVSVYRPDEFQTGSIIGMQNNNGLNLVVGGASRIVTPTIYYGASGDTSATLSCNVTMGTDWNIVTFTTNGLNSHKMYLNGNTTSPSTDTNTYNRSLYTPSEVSTKIGKNALSNNYLNGIMMAYLVYPFELTPKQIKRNWYVFRQRLTQFP